MRLPLLLAALALHAPFATPVLADAVADASVRAGIAMSEPRVRIALGSGEDEILVGARGGGFRVLDGATARPILDVRDGSARRAVAAGERTGTGGRTHSIQVGSFRGEDAARRLATELEREHRAPAEVRWQASRQVYRVRVGRAPDAGRLAELLRILRATGHPDAWIVSEAIDVLPDGRIRLFDAAWEATDAPGRSVLVVPARGARVTVDDRPYRGIVEVTITAGGQLLAINELPLEEYLLGVVPEELGPAAFPEIEALKAQAVAARTYIVANLDQFADEGYDICDTPRCQVYGGAASEHPLSDRAVRETRGLVLLKDGRPVNAMYTSTCGGHTEDLRVVFPDMTGDHLRGVPCHPERDEIDRRAIPLEGRDVGASSDAGPASPGLLDVARLVAAGVLPRAALDDGWARAPLAADELERALGVLAGLAGKDKVRVAGGGEWNRLAAWSALVALIDDAGGGHGLVEPRAVPLVLSHPDAGALPAGARPGVAALLAGGIVRPRSDGRLDPDGVPRRTEAVDWLVTLAERFAVGRLRSASVVRRSRGRLVLREGRTERTFDVDPAPDVLIEEAGAWRRASTVELWPGDRLYVAGERGGGRALALVAVRERPSLADDRASSRFRWEVARSRGEIERGLDAVAPVGVLLDLEVLSRGVSGRVAELEVRGTDGRAVVRGFRLRRALGLPETLFDLDVQRERDGPLRRVTFRGRGWGHGVGLCQYGAYGMARRGADFREILTHYYTGVTIRRAGGS